MPTRPGRTLHNNRRGRAGREPDPVICEAATACG